MVDWGYLEEKARLIAEESSDILHRKRRQEIIAVFISDNEIITLEANEMGKPVDPKGLFFGPESFRNLEDFNRHDVDTSSGVAMRIMPKSSLVATITM